MITYQGRDYDFALTRTSREELGEVKRKTGLTVRQLMEGISQLDVDAMTALRWLVLRCDGQHDDLPFNPDEEYDFWEWLQAFGEGDTEEEPDPTRAGTPPATSTPTSSESSAPTSATSTPSTASPSLTTAESANGRSDASVSAPTSPTSSASTP